MDFTLKTYHQLLDSLQNAGFFFQTYREFVENSEVQISNLEVESSDSLQNLTREAQITPKGTLQSITKELQPRKTRNHANTQPSQLLILRHNVDKRPQNSLRFAQIQKEKGIKGTYYFRMHPHSYHEEVIQQIADLGHEIGYHYETMDSVVSGSGLRIPGVKVKCRKFAGESPDESLSNHVNAAYEEFVKNLEKFRKIAEIKTISMHGSPMSPFDNRAIWQKYDYKTLGILAEPYFDLDFNQIYYITDTGRRWDGHLFNVRDKATKENPVTNKEFLKLRFHSTFDLIKAIEQGKFPTKAMLNFHPQRWNSNPYLWTKELILQNAKNQVKRFLVKK